MVKGLAHDDKSLRESGISTGSKVMVIGSTFDDVLALSHQTATVLLYYLFIVLDKGPPEDVMPGVKNIKVCFLLIHKCHSISSFFYVGTIASSSSEWDGKP